MHAFNTTHSIFDWCFSFHERTQPYIFFATDNANRKREKCFKMKTSCHFSSDESSPKSQVGFCLGDESALQHDKKWLSRDKRRVGLNKRQVVAYPCFENSLLFVCLFFWTQVLTLICSTILIVRDINLYTYYT